MAKRTFNLIRIVDDNEEYRTSEAFMLRMIGFNVVEYASAMQFLDEDDPSIPGCLILDVRMPDMDGIELQEVMSERSIGLPIIFLTGHGDVEMAVHALHSGASDFLLKPVDPEKLKESVEKAIEKSQLLKVQNDNEEQTRKLFDQLTDREKEVSRLVAKGLLNKQIAYELGISEHTVKVHRASAKYKLKARTPIDFVNCLKNIGEV